MRIFLAEQGQKTGPFSLWDVRARLDRGELAPETLGWHEGCAGWMPLRELPGLGWRPAPPPEPAEPPPVPAPPQPAAAPATARPRPWARFCARWFDLTLWMLLAALALRPFHFGFDRFLTEPWAQTISAMLMVLAEACCLAATGTTPGKALLGLRVTPAGGGPLPFPAALLRSFLVYLIGNALYMVFCVLAWVFHFIDLQRRQRTFWDRRLSLDVVSIPCPPQRILVFVGLFILMQMSISALVGHEVSALMREWLPGLPAPEATVPPAPGP